MKLRHKRFKAKTYYNKLINNKYRICYTFILFNVFSHYKTRRKMLYLNLNHVHFKTLMVGTILTNLPNSRFGLNNLNYLLLS